MLNEIGQKIKIRLNEPILRQKFSDLTKKYYLIEKEATTFSLNNVDSVKYNVANLELPEKLTRGKLKSKC